MPPSAGRADATRLNRRDALRLGLGAGLGAATASWFAARPAAAHPPLAALVPFAVPLTRPRVLRPLLRTRSTDFYRVVMREARQEILPGLSTPVWTYDGDFTGPTIRAHRNRQVVVRQVNQLDRPTSVHRHGGDNSQRSDGMAMDVIPPGRSKVYSYTNDQRAAQLWMHDHAHHLEAENVYRGLSNLYTLTDRDEQRLPLPRGRYDVPLILRDADFMHTGEMMYMMGDQLNRTTILVNGRPWPYVEVEGRKYRFRLTNSSNLRFFILRLSNQAPVSLIGTDGGLLEAPVTTPVLVATPGERVDFVIDFSQFPEGSTVVLENLIGPGPVELVGKCCSSGWGSGCRTRVASRPGCPSSPRCRRRPGSAASSSSWRSDRTG